MWKFHKNKPEHIHNMKEFNKLERSHSLWKQGEKEIVHIQLAHRKHLKKSTELPPAETYDSLL